MIFISSCYIKKNKISDILKNALINNIKNLEITAGTNFYQNINDDLKNYLKSKKINLRFHNYFPPPKKHFFINLASNNDKIRFSSIEITKKIIDTSSRFNSKIVGIHAGFLYDINPVNKKPFSRNTLNLNEGIKLFTESYLEIKKYADKKNIKLYLENNVLDKYNLKYFNNKIPLLLLTYNDYLYLKKKLNINLLLDVGHLKVTCKTLKLDFKKQFLQLSNKTDYFHLSDNDGIKDSNSEIKINSQMYKYIKKIKNFKKKNLTIEVIGLHQSLKTFNNLNTI